jgi:Lon protease-like protein
MDVLEIPLFPLHTVLFPGGPLALRVFEPRYLDMVSRAIRDDGAFGITLISEGEETGEAAQTYEVGTLGRVRYWHRRPDGMLGVTVVGEHRFRIMSREVQPDQLVTARVELLPDEPPVPLPEEFAPLAKLLEEIVEELDHPWINLPRRYDDAVWVGGRLTELLPVKLAQKQLLLQLHDPVERLRRLRDIADLGELVES